jgi:16S rRNA (guanine966-N2)-methyltransferase
MRVIGGKYRGRVLKEFAGKDVRPTSDRARESLFNIMQRKIPGCIFLDLFTGTGGMGIEALSRGAKEAFFVDASKESIALCKANLTLVKESTSNVYHADFQEALRRFSASGKKFDVVFIDPPYSLRAVPPTLESLLSAELLKPTSIVVCESAEEDVFENNPDLAAKFEIIKRAKYGVAHITIVKPII